jgi:predicted transcriptional regulator of viral defense system
VPKREFSPAFRTFINKNISSVEQIEVLLILHANPERVWTIEEISAILRSSPNSIRSRLTALEERNLCNGLQEAGYRYSAGGRLDEMVETLAQEYAQRRFSVIELVFSRPDAARSFADAFRLREEDEA